MQFYDRQGAAIRIGDHIVPDAGRELIITHEAEAEGVPVLMGYQAEDPLAFSYLTQEQLSATWTRTQTTAEEEI